MSRVVIVGAGFGGLGCAWTFANQVSKESVSSVVVVDSKDWFTIGGTWAYAWSDRTPVAETKWPLVDAKPRLPGVELRLNTSVVSIDTAGKTITLTDRPDEPVPYDYLVLAPGVVGDPSSIPGLDKCVDMYSQSHVERQKADLQRIVQTAKANAANRVAAEKKQTLAIIIAATPYKCPVAPFEAAFIADDFFRRHGVRDAVDITVSAPVLWPLPDPAKAIFERYLAEKDVLFLPCKTIKNVETNEAENSTSVFFEDGTCITGASAVWAVYPQTAPGFIKHAGLANLSGFVPANMGTNKVSNDVPNADSIFCVGDCAGLSASGKPHPKTGEFAWQMGEMVAHAIGNSGPEYVHSRLGACIAECGGGAGVLVAPDFTACVADPENGQPSATITDKKQGGEEYKLQWVGKYVGKLFGDEGRKFAPKAVA